MAKTLESTGKTIEDALRIALAQLNVGKNDVDVEVLEEPSKGLFGLFGNKPARIKVTVKEFPKPEPVEQFEEVVIEPPTVVNFKVVPVIESLPKVDKKIVEEEAPKVEDVPKVEEDTKEFEAVTKEVEDVPKVTEETKKVEESNLNRDEVIDRAKTFLTDLFNSVKMDIKIDVHEVDDNIILDLSGKESSSIIGKHGQTIDALQYLTNLAANKRSEDKVRFILDVENYREKREEILQKMARNVADRAVRMKQAVKMEPMSRHERRIVHMELQDNKRVETQSHGEEPFRYIVVSPVPKKKK